MRYSVVDGDENANVYGYATTERGAVRVARRYFVDPVIAADLYGPIHCADGTVLPIAFVCFTKDNAAR
jgi:hypothetical protein